MTLIHSTDEQKARSLELKILSCDTRAALIELCAYQPFSLTQKGHIVFVTRSKNIFNQDRFTIESFNSNVSPNKHTAQMHWFNRQLKLALKTYGLNAPLAFGLDLEVNLSPTRIATLFLYPLIRADRAAAFCTHAMSLGRRMHKIWPCASQRSMLIGGRTSLNLYQ